MSIHADDAEAVSPDGLPWYADVTPVDLFSEDAPPPEYVREHYPELIAEGAEDIAVRLGCDPVMPAWMMLATMAGAASDQIKLQVREHDTEWQEAARLWVGIVAQVAAGKSPALNAATKPLRALQAELRKTYEAEVEAMQKGEDDAEPPVLQRVLTNDATIESLGELLSKTDHGLLSIHDELATHFGSWDAYRERGSKDRGDWLRLYDGGHHVIDRIRRGTQFVENWGASLLGGVQPAVLAKLIGNRDLTTDGMLQRFVFVPARSRGVGEDRAPGYAATETWERVIRAVHRRREPQTVRFDPEAQTAMRGLLEQIDRLTRMPGMHPAIAEHFAKGQGLAARLVLTMHITDAAHAWATARVSSYGPLLPVPIFTVKRVERLMLEFVFPAIAYMHHNVLGRAQMDDITRRVADAVLTRFVGTFTERGVVRAVQNVKRPVLRDAMESLEMAGWIEPLDPMRRDSRLWEVHPRLHELLGERVKQAEERRRAARESIQAAAAQRREEKKR